jgi:hypothetical protein
MSFGSGERMTNFLRAASSGKKSDITQFDFRRLSCHLTTPTTGLDNSRVHSNVNATLGSAMATDKLDIHNDRASSVISRWSGTCLHTFWSTVARRKNGWATMCRTEGSKSANNKPANSSRDSQMTGPPKVLDQYVPP